MEKTALMVWGGWEGHTPRECVDLFAPRLEAHGYLVEISESLDAYLDQERMQRMDLIVQCVTMVAITPEQEKGLLQAVAEGAGFAGWHGGVLDAFRENVDFQWMIGGQWVAHPGDCVSSYRVDVVDTGHPVTRGIQSFSMTDTEQYYCHVDPSNHVLCTTTFTGEYGDNTRYVSGTVMPYAWTRTWGKGRVFVAGWGHTTKDFEVKEARAIMERGLLWASR
jgi:type 1 glutamine amidotransferase